MLHLNLFTSGTEPDVIADVGQDVSASKIVAFISSAVRIPHDAVVVGSRFDHNLASHMPPLISPMIVRIELFAPGGSLNYSLRFDC